jgi:hypothetical protein
MDTARLIITEAEANQTPPKLCGFNLDFVSAVELRHDIGLSGLPKQSIQNEKAVPHHTERRFSARRCFMPRP